MATCEVQYETGLLVDTADGELGTSWVDSGKPETDYLKTFIAEPGLRLDLGSIDPGHTGRQETFETALPKTRSYIARIDELQQTMHAEKKSSLLVILQGMDAGGKDGVVREIFAAINPAGCRVVGFKQPTADQLAHDFLWRVHSHVPARGEMVIFNRSHYEDVLVVRVHSLVPQYIYSGRYELINEFEKLLTVEGNTKILKFLLHISKEEQLTRFKRRLDDPARRWKVSESDYREREHWDDYVTAFEDMLFQTSTPYAPWFVIPSDQKWFRDLAVSQIISRTLETLNMKIPSPTVDIARMRSRYHAAEAEARAS